MPVYEYECKRCASRYEVKRGIHETGGSECPKCGGEGLQIFFPAPLHFKGSGFYVTDSRKKQGEAEGKEQPAKAETVKPAEPGNGSKAGPTAEKEAKPAALSKEAK
jgi:putative FmdB family regulatory protein